MTSTDTVLIPGLGNIGAYLSGLVARNPLVKTLIIADRDVVEDGNLLHQDFGPGDVGLPKARALQNRLRNLRPDLRVVAVEAPLEQLPGAAFGGVVLLALDSNTPRSVAAERVFRMGGYLIDCGVNGQAGLARVTRIDPGPTCLECPWTAATYSNGLVYSCSKAPPTNAPAALGAAAAALAATQLHSLLADGESVGAREYVMCPMSGQLHTSDLVRNPDCRFDHQRFSTPLQMGYDADLSLGALQARTGESLAVLGFAWAARWFCGGCGYKDEKLRISRRQPCPSCGETLFPEFGHSFHVLERAGLAVDSSEIPVSELGIVPGEILTSPSGHCFQLGQFSGLRQTDRSAVLPISSPISKS